jgi:hypothetical protein
VAQTLPIPTAQADCAVRKLAASRRWDAPAPLRFWHLASLDAPTVAVVWSLAFAWAGKVSLPGWIPLLLALAAWCAYIADRLLDARAALRTGNHQTLRERHWFHHRHRRLLGPLAVAAACAAGCIVIRVMPAAGRERNSVLAVAALAYFTRVHSSRRHPADGLSLARFSGVARFFKKELFVKELFVGLLFTAACTLPALNRALAETNVRIWPLLAAAAFFAMLAWLNCHAIERWETEPSQQAGGVCFSGAKAPVSSARFTRGLKPPPPSGSSATAACVLAVLGLTLACILFHPQPRSAALVLAGTLSAILLAFLDRLRSRLTPLALRVSADLILLTPLALLVR